MSAAGQAPVLTVFIPVYNGEAFLDAAVRSVLAQEGPTFELLVVDDGSTDSTPTLLAGLAAGDSRIRVITHPRARLARGGPTPPEPLFDTQQAQGPVHSGLLRAVAIVEREGEGFGHFVCLLMEFAPALRSQSPPVTLPACFSFFPS